MTCEHVILPDGGSAIVCSSHKRQRCRCGRDAMLLCDWKMPRGGTCDEPICSACAESPAPGKDLCREHQAAFREWKAQRAVPRQNREAVHGRG